MKNIKLVKKVLASAILASAVMVHASADEAKLRYIIDGDTAVFSNTTCRLAYIDTPESKPNKKAQRDIRKSNHVTLDDVVYAGRQSKKYLESIMQKGQYYKFDIITTDRYDRSVCVIYKNDGRSINDMIVANGFAVPFWRYIPKSKQPQLRNLSMKADRENRGLWRISRPVMEMMY